MILDNLHTTMCAYENGDFRFARAFKWLRTTDLKSLEVGKVATIDGGRVFAQVLSYETKKFEDAIFETHRSFADIQVMVSGREKHYWAPLSSLGPVKTPYNFEKDLVFFEEPEIATEFVLEEGQFAIYYPSDGHKPGVAAGGREQVKKIVVKVAL